MRLSSHPRLLPPSSRWQCRRHHYHRHRYPTRSSLRSRSSSERTEGLSRRMSSVAASLQPLDTTPTPPTPRPLHHLLPTENDEFGAALVLDLVLVLDHDRDLDLDPVHDPALVHDLDIGIETVVAAILAPTFRAMTIRAATATVAIVTAIVATRTVAVIHIRAAAATTTDARSCHRRSTRQSLRLVRSYRQTNRSSSASRDQLLSRRAPPMPWWYR